MWILEKLSSLSPHGRFLHKTASTKKPTSCKRQFAKTNSSLAFFHKRVFRFCGKSVANALLRYGHDEGGNTMNVKQELLNGLTADQIEKVAECDNTFDLLQLAKDEGVELNDEQLDAVSGGGCGGDDDKNKDKDKDEGHRKIES